MSSIPNVLDRARLGPPIAQKGLTIVPITLSGNGHRKLDYIPLDEGIASGKARITEISESGSVPELVIRNDADVAVFILDGEELIGAKQNRIVNLSILVPAKTALPLPVTCVERGRWSYRTRHFDVSPYAMFSGGRAAQMSAVTMHLRSSGARDGDQMRAWHDVSERAAALGVCSPTQAMADSYQARRAILDDIVSGFKPLPDQAGGIFAVGGRVVGVELFETAEVFGRYFAKVIRSYALDALVQRMHRDFVATEAEALLADLRRAESSRFKSVGLGEDVRISQDDLVGGALLLEDRVVHLAAFRKAVAEPTSSESEFFPEMSEAQKLAWWSRARNWWRNRS
ncbi:MAG: DUF6569 family protein [Gemmatimonadaceae bacterium]